MATHRSVGRRELSNRNKVSKSPEEKSQRRKSLTVFDRLSVCNKQQKIVSKNENTNPF